MLETKGCLRAGVFPCREERQRQRDGIRLSTACMLETNGCLHARVEVAPAVVPQVRPKMVMVFVFSRKFYERVPANLNFALQIQFNSI